MQGPVILNQQSIRCSELCDFFRCFAGVVSNIAILRTVLVTMWFAVIKNSISFECYHWFSSRSIFSSVSPE